MDGGVGALGHLEQDVLDGRLILLIQLDPLLSEGLHDALLLDPVVDTTLVSEEAPEHD